MSSPGHLQRCLRFIYSSLYSLKLLGCIKGVVVFGLMIRLMGQPKCSLNYLGLRFKDVNMFSLRFRNWNLDLDLTIDNICCSYSI